LVAPVTVITPQGDIELGSGSLLIGRLPECDVLLQDGLVSRMHARISVQHDAVVVEDLHSTNGVYVNGMRVGHSTVLREGDRVLIGTTEISMFESRDSSLMRIKQARRTSSLPSPPVRIQPASSAVTKAPPNAVTRPIVAPAASTPKRAAGLAEIPSTARADALQMIGGLADRLAATGNLEEAAQVLSGHLRRILKGANAGLQVPADVAASASHHALTLARWTRQPLWADYVVELHLSARLVMNAVTLAGFEDVASKLEDFDRMLLGYYVDGLRDRSATLSLDERTRVERLERLAKG
jgi:pSer/pThr/pTyr-binding forkhead associated (FHA) protein